MAKHFLTPDEAAEKLGTEVSALEDFVRGGRLREFRDAGRRNYHTSDIDTLAAELARERGDSKTGAVEA